MSLLEKLLVYGDVVPYALLAVAVAVLVGALLWEANSR